MEVTCTLTMRGAAQVEAMNKDEVRAFDRKHLANRQGQTGGLETDRTEVLRNSGQIRGWGGIC